MKKLGFIAFSIVLICMLVSAIVLAIASYPQGKNSQIIRFDTPSPTPATSYTSSRCEPSGASYACVSHTYNFPVSDECHYNDDCSVTYQGCDASNPSQCVTYHGKGEDECTTNQDCQQKTHNDCRYSSGAWTCTSVSGVDASDCIYDSDCTITTHNICSSQACVQAAGGGPNECGVNTDCLTPNPKKCDYLRRECRLMYGYGSDECTSSFTNECPHWGEE